MIDFTLYQALAARTINPDCMSIDGIVNHTLGLAGETGEVVELVKKISFHGKPIDKARLSEEIGDVLWYVAAVCTSLELSLEDVAASNIDKLTRRYPNGFQPKLKN